MCWYHPRLERKFDDFLTARSIDPVDGEIVAGAFDLAVVQLSAEGPDPRSEMDIGTSADFASRGGQPVGMLSFREGDLTGSQDSASAKFSAHALLSPIVHVQFSSPGQSFHSMHYFESDLMFGASGSPLFIGYRRVVGVLVGGKPVANMQVEGASKIGFLHELLYYHKLEIRAHLARDVDGDRSGLRDRSENLHI